MRSRRVVTYMPTLAQKDFEQREQLQEELLQIMKLGPNVIYKTRRLSNNCILWIKSDAANNVSTYMVCIDPEK